MSPYSAPRRSPAGPSVPVKWFGFLVIVLVSAFIAGLGNTIRAWSQQGPGPEQEAVKQLDKRRAQLRDTANPFRQQDILYRAQREQRVFRQRYENEQRKMLAEEGRDRAYRESLQRFHQRQPTEEAERARVFTEAYLREEAYRRSIDEDPKVRIAEYMKQFRLARMEVPGGDTGEAWARVLNSDHLSEGVSGTAGEDKAPGPPPAGSGYIASGAEFSDWPADFGGRGTVTVFDSHGFPVGTGMFWGEWWSYVLVEYGEYYVVAEIPGFSLLYWDGAGGSTRGTDAQLVTVSDAVTPTLFILPSGGSFSGRLTDTAGNPIVDTEEIYFELYRDTGNSDREDYPINEVTPSLLDSDGNYTVRGLEAGSYYLELVSWEYIPLWYDNVTNSYEATPLVFESRDTSHDGIDFTLQEGQTIMGRAYELDGATPVTSTSTVTGTAYLVPRLPGATPPLDWMNDDQRSAYIYNYNNGYFTFSGVAAGEYYLYVRCDGNYAATFWEGDYEGGGGLVSGPGLVATPDGATVLTVTAGVPITDTLRVVMDEGGILQGTLLNPDSTAAKSATVWARHLETNSLFIATTNDTGGFAFNQLPGGTSPGHYQIQAPYEFNLPFYYTEDGGSYTFSDTDTVSLPVGETVTLDEWRPSVGATITGTVTDTSGTPIPGWVLLYDSTGYSYWAFADTSGGAGGRYEFKYLIPGDYIVATSYFIPWQNEVYENYPADPVNAGATVITIADGETYEADFVLQRMGVIEGYIIEDGTVAFYGWQMDIEVWDADNPRRLMDFEYDWEHRYAAGTVSDWNAPQLSTGDSLWFWIYGLKNGDYKVRIVEYEEDYYYGYGSYEQLRVGATSENGYTGQLWPNQFYRAGEPATDGSPSWAGADPVTVVKGDTSDTVVFTLEAGGMIQGFVHYGEDDTTTAVAADSLDLVVLFFDSESGGYADTGQEPEVIIWDMAKSMENTLAGGFRSPKLLPGSYKVAVLGEFNNQSASWYSTGGTVDSYGDAGSIAVSAGVTTDIVHYIRSQSGGGTISGGVYLLNQQDPSPFTSVVAYDSDGYPAGFDLTERDYYYDEMYPYPAVSARAGTDPGSDDPFDSDGSYEIQGLRAGDYFLRTWSPDLLIELLYHLAYCSWNLDISRPPVTPYLFSLRDMWWNQHQAESLLEYLVWMPEEAAAVVSPTADAVTLSAGTPVSSRSGVNFYLAVLNSGDPNGDGVFDVADIVALVNSILGIVPFGPGQASVADLNGDGVADIGDVVAMVVSLVGGSAAGVPSYTTVSGDYLVALGSPESDAGITEIPVWTRFEGPVAGLQLALKVDGEAEVLPADLPTGVSMTSHRVGDEVRVLLYSTSGTILPERETRLLNIKMPGAASAFAENAVTFSLVKGATPGGAMISMQSYGMGEGPIGITTRFSLEQNWPNPFNPNTTIAFTLPEQSRVRLSVLNVRGQLVKTLVEEQLGAGPHTVRWDGTNSDGRPVATGIYLYVIEAGRHRASKKMLLVR